LLVRIYLIHKQMRTITAKIPEHSRAKSPQTL